MGKKSEPTPDSDIAKFVRAARKKLEMSGDTLAAIFGQTRGNVSAWENGRHEPPYATLLKLSDMAGLPLPGQVDAWPFQTISRAEWKELQDWQKSGIEVKLREFIEATSEPIYPRPALEDRKSSNGG